MRRIFILTTVLLIAMVPAAFASTYDITADFSADNGNPYGPWSYGWMDNNFTSFTLYTAHYSNQNATGWSGWNGDGTPGIWKNLGPLSYQVPTGWLSIHPGPGWEPSVVRWTAPVGVGGPASITGQFLAGDWGTMQVAVRKNGVEIWQARDSGSFDLSTDILPGDFLDFAVYGGHGWGNTPVSASITVVPEPSALAVLAAGSSLFGLMLRKRR